MNPYYNCTINVWYDYYISQKGLLEEWDREGNVEVTEAATTSC